VKLNLDCSGEGGITVILDSGMGGSALDWILVQPEVAKFTRVCSYDRAGYGWSDVSPVSRTSLQIAQELKSLLDAAGEKGPFVMVGHSFGGYNVRVFTGQYPKQVLGLVLVDASHPDEGPRTDAVLSAAQLAKQGQNERRGEMWERIVEPLTIHLGIQRFTLALGLKRSRHLLRSLQEEFLYLEHMPKYRRTIQDEDAAFRTSGEQAVAAGSLGDRPLIVLTAGKPYQPDPLLTPEQMETQKNIWIRICKSKRCIFPAAADRSSYRTAAMTYRKIAPTRSSQQFLLCGMPFSSTRTPGDLPTDSPAKRKKPLRFRSGL
jgi:pimeloyl-ACP methyl ester carboxylesterase